MKITNHAGLPEPIVAAVTADDYVRGDADYTVTELLTPPWMLALRRKHEDDITEDAADRIWSLMGQCIHTVLERAGQGLEDEITERRLQSDFGGKTLSGQFDHVALKNGILTDYKVTSVWKIIHGDFKDWEAQANMYAELARREGIEVKSVQVVAILRDWSKWRAKAEPDYPDTQVKRLPLKLWPDGEAEGYILEAIAAHEDVTASWCTPAERWQSPTQYAVKKPANKRATKVFGDKAEAGAWLTEPGHADYVLEERPGENKRCENYCSVAPYCSWWRANAPATPPMVRIGGAS